MSDLFINIRFLFWHFQWSMNQKLPRIRFNRYAWNGWKLALKNPIDVIEFDLKYDNRSPIERIFGRAPKVGYKFEGVKVELVDNDMFKGFYISWSASGVGFGTMFFGWGDKEKLKGYPHQQGFHASTECMGEEFVEALMREALPEINKLILKARFD